jgi:DUF971 family protein
MPTPVSINLKKVSRILSLIFDDNTVAELSCEFLRVYSPSAEVKGHGPGQSVLQTGKENINITSIEPIGNYAIKLIFDDGHNSGIYTWKYLFELSSQKDKLWDEYINALAEEGYSRKENVSV